MVVDLVPNWTETFDVNPLFLRPQNAGAGYEGIQRLQAILVFDLKKECFVFVRGEDFKTRPRFCTIARAMSAEDRKMFMDLQHTQFGFMRAAYFARVEGGKCHKQVTTPVCCTRVAPVWHCYRC